MGILEFGFARNSLLASAVMALFLPGLSFFIVTRRLSFTGVGISHSAFGGLALGVLVGINPLWAAVGFALVVALALAEAARRGVPEDTTTGVLFAGTMALGVMFLAVAGGSRVDLWTYLFGNILSVSRGDILVLAVICVACVAFGAVSWKGLLLSTFDEELARAGGVRVGLLNTLLLVLVSFTVVGCLKAVGIVLLSGLLVFPGAVGARLAVSCRAGFVASYIVGALAIFGGLALSFTLNLPSGASIILVGTLLFLASLFVRR